MKKLFSILFVFYSIFQLTAQQVISGKITDTKGYPITGANVFIKDTYDGASTDTSGFFKFKTNEKGKQILQLSFIGMKGVEKEIDLTAEVPPFQFKMEEENAQLQTITISAGAFETGETVKSLVLKPMDIATTPSAVGDIYGALSSLPGSQIVGNQGGLYVRGGEAYETKTFIDGMPVVNPYMAKMPDIATRSQFSPLLFAGTVFSTGGYSAEYGQALSSALNLNTVGIAEATESSVMLMSVGLNASHTQRWDKSSLSISLDYNDMGLYYPLVRKNMEWNRYPVRAGGTALYRIKRGKYSMIKVFGSSYWNYSSLKYSMKGVDSGATDINLGNLDNYLNTIYTDRISEKWRFKAGFAMTKDDTKTDIGTDKLLESVLAVHERINLINEVTNNISIKYGQETNFYKFDQNYFLDSISTEFNSGLKDVNYAHYIESDIKINNHLAIRFGLRGEYSSLMDEWSLSPRISASCRIADNGKLSIAYGTFNQRPEKEYLIYSSKLSPEKAKHYIANYQYEKDNRIFRLEVYQKDYLDLVKYETLYNPNPATYSNNGNGFARGIDIFWRDSKTVKNLDYWISYSYIYTKRDYKNNVNSITPAFISPHTFNAVAKYQIPKITAILAATYTYASSKNYYNPYFQNSETNKTPDYNDLSLSVTKVFIVFKKMVALFVNANNVLGFNNIYGYNYSSIQAEEENYQAYPIKPMTKRFFVVGFYFMFK